MSPEEFAREIVIPTIREFRDDRHSNRRAYLVCIATYHLSDYLKREGIDVEEALKTFRCTSFEVVRAVCHGTKHKGWTPNRPEHIQFVPGQEYHRPPCVAGLAVADLSTVGDGIGGFEIEFDRGGFDLYSSIKIVLEQYLFYFSEFLHGVDFKDC